MGRLVDCDTLCSTDTNDAQDNDDMTMTKDDKDATIAEDDDNATTTQDDTAMTKAMTRLTQEDDHMATKQDDSELWGWRELIYIHVLTLKFVLAHPQYMLFRFSFPMSCGRVPSLMLFTSVYQWRLMPKVIQKGFIASSYSGQIWQKETI